MTHHVYVEVAGFSAEHNSPWAAEEIEQMKRRLMSGTIASLSMCDAAILANATSAAATRRAAVPITRRVAQGL
jgi:hypothetical protein